MDLGLELSRFGDGATTTLDIERLAEAQNGDLWVVDDEPEDFLCFAGSQAEANELGLRLDVAAAGQNL